METEVYLIVRHVQAGRRVGEWLVGGLKQGHPNETRASHSGSRRLKGREKSD